MLPQPRLCFLLADDPGAGKIIMAGFLVKEMKLREAIERVLILCPSPLTIQWQDEMLRWFTVAPRGGAGRVGCACRRETLMPVRRS